MYSHSTTQQETYGNSCIFMHIKHHHVTCLDQLICEVLEHKNLCITCRQLCIDIHVLLGQHHFLKQTRYWPTCGHTCSCQERACHKCQTELWVVENSWHDFIEKARPLSYSFDNYNMRYFQCFTKSFFSWLFITLQFDFWKVL